MCVSVKQARHGRGNGNFCPKFPFPGTVFSPFGQKTGTGKKYFSWEIPDHTNDHQTLDFRQKYATFSERNSQNIDKISHFFHENFKKPYFFCVKMLQFGDIFLKFSFPGKGTTSRSRDSYFRGTGFFSLEFPSRCLSEAREGPTH